MKKLLKVTGIFILSISVLTGCSDKVAKKVDNSRSVVTRLEESAENKFQQGSNNKTTKEDKENNRIIQENSNSIKQDNIDLTHKSVWKDNQSNSNYKHDFKEVEKLLNVMEYSLSNTKNSKMIDIIRFSASISSTQNQVVYLPAANLLDRLNTNNAETYNVNAVLNKLFVENGVKLVTANKAKSEYTPAELEKLVPDNNTVVYFKKDNMFAIRSVVGYGGTTNSIFAPTEDWKVEGDKILIPYVTVATNKPTGLMTVRLNNKVYPNGQNKTMYYVESFIYY